MARGPTFPGLFLSSPSRRQPLAGERVDSPLQRARRAAMRELARPGCACCGSLQRHVALRVGSTLFLDEAPSHLQESFPPSERSFITPRVLAACIVLGGRERVGLFATQQSPGSTAARPAVELLAAGEPPVGQSKVAAAGRLPRAIQQLIESVRQEMPAPDARLYRALGHLQAAVEELTR